MRYLELKTEAERQAARDKGLKSAVYHVCWRCGSGGHNKKTLRRVGRTAEGAPIYGCLNHYGLLGQL